MSPRRVLPSLDGRHLLVFRAQYAGGRRGRDGAAVYDVDRPTFVRRTSLMATSSPAWTGPRLGSRSSQAARTGWCGSDGGMESEPHLLMGHEAAVWRVQASTPRGRWLASAATMARCGCGRCRKAQPFHTLPHAALLDRLRKLTNYRVVEDAASPGGYRLDVEPFKGWKQRAATMVADREANEDHQLLRRVVVSAGDVLIVLARAGGGPDCSAERSTARCTTAAAPSLPGAVVQVTSAVEGAA